MMKRKILEHLQAWARQTQRKPLILRGARQVGKSFVVDQLGTQFKHYIKINFELEPHFIQCFESLEPTDIVNRISLLQQKPIIAGETLLFFDEIQVCPQAIQALRYFKEKRPDLHVIAAGSLLEFALREATISMPVGRVEYLYMYPCSFNEFLQNAGYTQVLEALEQVDLEHPLPQVVHEQLLKQFQEYMVVGGMPEALASYLQDHDLYRVQRIQNSILQTYRDDFAKYANRVHHKYLQVVYDQAAAMLGQQISFSKMHADFRSRDLKEAIVLLEYAGVVKRIYATAGSGLPLSATLNEKKFKLHFLDVGLAQRKTGLDAALLLSQDILQLNQGALAEQVVAEEWLAYQDPFVAADLFFWARDAKNASAEVDFLVNVQGQMIPIEVKSGSLGHLKSLNRFLAERNAPLGIRICNAPLSQQGQILTLPFYLMNQLPRLASLVIRSLAPA